MMMVVVEVVALHSKFFSFIQRQQQTHFTFIHHKYQVKCEIKIDGK